MTADELSDEERQKCEVWTRVMGYYRPVCHFNPGKQSEFYERRPFQEDSEGVVTALSYSDVREPAQEA